MTEENTNNSDIKNLSYQTFDIDIDDSSTTSNKKHSTNNNFYSYNPPPIPIIEAKKAENALNIPSQSKQHQKKEIIDPKENDIKDIVLDEDGEEIDETNSYEDNLIFNRKKPRKKQRREEIEVIESEEEEEDINNKNDENKI